MVDPVCRSCDQDNLAHGVTAADGPVCLGGLLEREDVPHHTADPALAGQLQQLRDDRSAGAIASEAAAQPVADDGLVLVHELRARKASQSFTRHAVLDQPAKGRQAVQALLADVTAHRVEDDIDAAAAAGG